MRNLKVSIVDTERLKVMARHMERADDEYEGFFWFRTERGIEFLPLALPQSLVNDIGHYLDYAVEKASASR